MLKDLHGIIDAKRMFSISVLQTATRWLFHTFFIQSSDLQRFTENAEVCLLFEWKLSHFTERWGWKLGVEKCRKAEKRCSFSGGALQNWAGVCDCEVAVFFFLFGGVQGIIFIRVCPAPSMSTPCTRSRSKSGHRDSETRTKVARWAPCVRSCLPSFWHCYTCSRLPTEVRPLILSALRLISQCSIILHVFEYLKAVQKFLKVALFCILQEHWA